MKNAFIYFVLFIITISITAFDLSKVELESVSTTYSFTRNGDDSPLIKLKLNEDNTFELSDRSNPNKIIDVKGKYNLRGNKVSLYDYDSKYSIANTWIMDQNNPCINSRKALKYTRICDCVKQ